MSDTSKQFHPYVIEDCKSIDELTGGNQFKLDGVYLLGIPDTDFENYCKLYSCLDRSVCKTAADRIVSTLSKEVVNNSFKYIFLEKKCCLTYGDSLQKIIYRTYYKFLNITEMQVWWFSEPFVL